MKMQTIGHNWAAGDTLSPQIIESRYCVLPQVDLPKRSCYPYWVLDYDFISGCDYRLDGDNWHKRPARRAHLYPPHTVYWEKPKPSTEYIVCSWILFSGKLEKILGRFVSNNGHAVFEDNGGRIGELLKEAAEISQSMGQDAYWHVHSRLAEILAVFNEAAHAIDELWQVNHDNSRHSHDFIVAVNNYLRAHLTETITVDMLAAEIGMGGSSLAHRYREKTGTTPIATLITMRIELAKTLLRRGYKLKYIAEHTGFSDEYHLAKTFKKITGQTPGEFRNHV